MDFKMTAAWTQRAALIVTLAAAGAAQAQDGEIRTKQYDDGGVYEGTFKNGLQHGTGSYTLPNGYQYRGDWAEGEIRGTGVARFPNGSVYEGEFAAGKPNGVGKITFTDGGTYEGTWEDG
ncbi:MAG TPA: 2-isopropylmalate synthase, partial [Roseovarius nubinhibens]|nr:2-isopropylmalate synthase [Roseovarius nubinhibens]